MTEPDWAHRHGFLTHKPNKPMIPNPLRRKQATKAVLETLAMAGTYALEQSRLMSFTNDLIKPPLDRGEQGVILKLLSDGGFIVRVPDSLDPELDQWVITDHGKAHLLSISN